MSEDTDQIVNDRCRQAGYPAKNAETACRDITLRARTDTVAKNPQDVIDVQQFFGHRTREFAVRLVHLLFVE